MVGGKKNSNKDLVLAKKLVNREKNQLLAIIRENLTVIRKEKIELSLVGERK